VPTLRELQREFARALTDAGAVAFEVPEPMRPRLEIYANTRLATLTHALGLSFPTVRALVGQAFFAVMAQEFITAAPPASAYLNDYGMELPRFLRSYAPAAVLSYLADVAELEWAVSRACHAPDAPRLDPRRLAELAPEALACVIFSSHPSLAVLHLAYPADRIWRSVLERDEEGMRALDLSAGPVCLLVERDLEEQVQVRRLTPAAFQLTQRLLAGEPLFQALSLRLEQPGPAEGEAQFVSATEAESTLAEHLLARRFIGCRLDDSHGGPSS
jgi:hypothetical protein